MSDSLKKDILKAVADGKKATNSTPKDTPVVFKDPQILQHSLDKSLKNPQRLAEDINKKQK